MDHGTMGTGIPPQTPYSGAMTENPSSDFDLKRLQALIWKRRYPAVLAALIVASIFTWGSFIWPETYEASSTVFIERGALMNPLLEGAGAAVGMQERLRNLNDGIRSRNIIDRVIKSLDLDVNIQTPDQYDSLVRKIRENLIVELTADRSRRSVDRFKVSYRGKDPETVMNLVNTIVNEYINENLKYTRTDAYEVYDFIEGQLMEYKKKLEESDAAIRAFRERNPNMIPRDEATILARVEKFQSERIATDIRIKELMKKSENLRKQLSGEKELTVAFVSKEGSTSDKLAYLNSQLVLLLTKYTDKYPAVIKLKAEIEELKREISRQSTNSRSDLSMDNTSTETSALNPVYQAIKEELARTDAEIESLKERSAELLRQQKIAQEILGRMPREQEEWAKLQRDRKVYQEIYDDLLVKLQNARVSKEIQLSNKAANFRVVDPAYLPLYPVKPDRVKMIFLGIFLGIVSGVAVSYLIETMAGTFKDETSIETRLSMPVLASIPRILTEADKLRVKRRDRKVFAAAGLYLLVILAALAQEILYRYLGIKLVDM